MSKRPNDSEFSSLIILLTIVFSLLKLLGAITWSWLWVFTPVWLPYVISFLLFMGMCIRSVFKE